MINIMDLRSYIIEVALKEIDMYSDDAVHLLLVTAALESDLGFHLKQTNGPALGIYQMEPDTHDDIWDSVLAYNSNKLQRMIGSGNGFSAPGRMIYDLKYATCMARVLYSRFKDAIPGKQDTDSIIHYYLKYWKPNPKVMTFDKAKIKYKYYFGSGIQHN
jgi:hypothetical protein